VSFIEDQDDEGDRNEFDESELLETHGGVQVDRLQRVRLRKKPSVVVGAEELLSRSVVGDVGCDRRLGAVPSHLDEVVLQAKTFESVTMLDGVSNRDLRRAATSHTDNIAKFHCPARNLNNRAGFCDATCRSDPKYAYFAMLQHSSFVVLGCTTSRSPLSQRRAIESRIWDALMMSAIPLQLSCDGDARDAGVHGVFQDMRRTLDSTTAQDALDAMEPKKVQKAQKILQLFAAEGRDGAEDKLDKWNVVQRKLARSFRSVLEKLATGTAVFLRERAAQRAAR